MVVSRKCYNCVQQCRTAIVQGNLQECRFEEVSTIILEGIVMVGQAVSVVLQIEFDILLQRTPPSIS